MKIKSITYLVLFALLCRSLPAESLFGLTASAGIDIPVTNRDIYNLGGSGTLTGTFRLGSIPYLRASGHIDFAMTSTPADTNLTALSFGGGLEAIFPLLPILDLRPVVSGGYGFFFYEGETYGSPYIKGEIQLLFNLSSSFRLGISGGYKHYFPNSYSGITAGLGTVISLGADKDPALDVEEILVNPLFPVLYKFYDENSFGSVSIINREKSAIRNIKVSLFVESYMDGPKECIVIQKMEKDEIREVPLYALFNESVLNITEGTKVQTEVIIEYEYLNDQQIVKTTESLRLYDRNAMTWDDDNKAAAFITAKDPSVLTFSKNFAGMARDLHFRSVDHNLSMAMGIYEALRLYGLNYIRDPSSPYDVLSEDELAIDYLQFPNQTLQYKAGDCDDLSILYSSLLEAAGVETAFVTTPGHIYIAFALKATPDEARRIFHDSGDLIYWADKAWIPVEVTLLDQGFLKSWETGLSLWRKYDDQKGFYPIHSAWNTYEPVGFSPDGKDMELPDLDEFAEVYSAEMEKFIQQQIQLQINELLAQLETAGDKGRVYNKIGVLYARFGLYERAEFEFRKGVALFSYPSMINLANILFLNDDYAEAKDLFNKALERRPDSTVAKLGLAKAEYELNQFGKAQELYEELIMKKPEWANEFAYLGSGSDSVTRASDQMGKYSMFWEEE